jgi:hypothetical protein
LDEARETLAQADKIALKSQGKESVRRALASTPDNGLLECYVEAVRLQSIAEQKEDEQQFTTRAAKASDMDLADQWAIYNAIYTELMASPDAFMRQLTVGFIRLMDEVRLEKRDEKAGGDRTRQRKDDAVTGDVFRHGNLFISFGWPNGPEGLGDWSHPNLELDPHAETSRIHSETAGAIAGARIKDLPLSMTFSFWAIDKSLPWYANKVKVEFDRDPEGNIYVEHRDSLEWLAKYFLGADRQLTEREQRLNAWYGARKLYHELRNKRIGSVKGLSYL